MSFCFELGCRRIAGLDGGIGDADRAREIAAGRTNAQHDGRRREHSGQRPGLAGADGRVQARPIDAAGSIRGALDVELRPVVAGPLALEPVRAPQLAAQGGVAIDRCGDGVRRLPPAAAGPGDEGENDDHAREERQRHGGRDARQARQDSDEEHGTGRHRRGARQSPHRALGAAALVREGHDLAQGTTGSIGGHRELA